MIFTQENIIRESEMQYSIGQESYLTDAEYDYLLSGVDEDNGCVLSHVPILDNTKFVTSPFWMGSVRTFFEGDGGLTKWQTTLDNDLVYITPKLDGTSVMYWNDNGTMRLANRSKKQDKCQDITSMLPYMKMPDIPENVACRGEFVTTKASFDYIKTRRDYICHRNMIAGLVRHFSIDNYHEMKYVELASYVMLVVYEVFIDGKVYGMHDIPEYVREMLKDVFNSQIDLAPVFPLQRELITESYMNEVQQMLDSEYEYPVDGIVIYVDSDHTPNDKVYPTYCRAYKPTLNIDSAEVVITNITWGNGVTGQLTPILHFDSVWLCDANISSVTAHNAKNMKVNDIGIGSIVKIIRSGKVIPKIIDVIHTTGFVMPSVSCYWDEHNTHLMSHIDDVSMTITRIHHFVSEINAKGIGHSLISKLYTLGCRSIGDMFLFAQEDLVSLGPTRSVNTGRILHSALSNASLVDIMMGSNCFPRGIGRERLESIVTAFPNLDFTKYNIMALHGFSNKTTTSVMKGINDFKSFVESSIFIQARVSELTNTIKPIEMKGETSHCVTFTGFRDKGLISLLESKGMKYKRNMVNETTILVTATNETHNKTVIRAKEDDIIITNRLDFESFITSYNPV